MPNLMLYDGDMVGIAEKYGFKGYSTELLLPAGRLLYRHLRQSGALYAQGRLYAAARRYARARGSPRADGGQRARSGRAGLHL